MAKKIKLTKTQQKKLLRSWLGIIVILAVIGYNFYQQNKSIPTGERFEVTLDRCVDGDTAWFNVDGESTKVRFLYIAGVTPAVLFLWESLWAQGKEGQLVAVGKRIAGRVLFQNILC